MLIRIAMRLGLFPLLFAGYLAACAGPAKHVSADPEKSAFLFPLGNYVHEVKLDIPSNPDPSKRTFTFRGAVKISADAIRIVVLSPIGTTLFRMSEDRATGKVTVENFVDSLKPYESKLTDYYASLRVLLTMLRRPPADTPGLERDPEGRPLSFKTSVDGRPTRFTFARYDEHQIPTALGVVADSFTVDVKVLGYEI
ncbi:MAG: hypothetical protein JST04_06420 [Bdellovibrionales bacterium]|nr:hypothetical protein [Bdellovibrionales bacterium]